MKRTYIFSLILSLVFVLCSTVNAFAIQPDHLPQEVNDFIKEREEGTASVSLGVFKEGNLRYKTQYGDIDRENKIPADEDAIYEWGSVSKTLVWISLMQLEEEGKIQLEKDVKTYLPKEFADRLNYPSPITLIDIMSLKTGFQEVGVKVEYEEGEEIPELGELLLMSEPTQVFKPGTVVAYNNWTPALAAYVVESVSGQKFYNYVQEHIFLPLQMKHTAAAADWSDNDYVREHRKQTKCYYYTSEDRESLGPCILHIGLYPAGAATGTFDDFLTYAMEFTSDHPRFFKKAETYEKMLEATVIYGDGLPRIHHGLLSLDGKLHLVGHSGNTMGFTSSFWFDPGSKTGYAVMTNEPAETSYNYGFAQALYGSGSVEAKEGGNLSGLYTSERSIHRGALRFVKYLAGILPIKTTDEPGIYKVPLAGMTVTYEGNHRYYFDNGNGLAYEVVEGNDGETLETFTGDYSRLSPIEAFAAYGLLIAMLLTLLSMVLRLIYGLIKLIKSREAKLMSPGFVSHLAGTLVSGSFIYLWLLTDSYSKTKLGVVAAISILCSAVIIFNFIRAVRKKTQDREVKLGAVTWSLLIPMAVIFYQLYNFWD